MCSSDLVDQQIKTQRTKNEQLKARNNAMAAEVRDLKDGLEAVEERARSELGMIKQDEIFFQILPPGQAVPQSRPPGTATPPAR